MNAQTIIEEAIKATMSQESEPKDFWERLIWRDRTTESEKKSKIIMYLTGRISTERELVEKAEIRAETVFRDALEIIGRFDPKLELEFYNNHV